MFYSLLPLQTICTPLYTYFIVTLLQQTLSSIAVIACDTAATVNNTFVEHSLCLHSFVQLLTTILYKVMVIVSSLLVIVASVAAILPKVATAAFYPFSEYSHFLLYFCKMKFSLGFSPCPNDTFIFDALVNHKIDTEGFEFDVVLEDVQTLNQWAMEGKLDFSKISYGVLPVVTRDYAVLESGGALGKGVGPLLITTKDTLHKKEVKDMRVAIPGQNTTAHLLFSFAYPAVKEKVFMVFNEIEDAVKNGRVDAGVIIHENRFTYQLKGLQKIQDLGEYWENNIHAPIPLGGIVGKRSIDRDHLLKMNRLIRKSLEYSFEHYPAVSDYVKQHAQEMEESVMLQHIDLYVNNFSLQLGDEGKIMVEKLLEVYQQITHSELINTKNVFVQ